MSFNKLGLILTRGVSLRLKRKFYRMCVQGVLVYGSETWPIRPCGEWRGRENDKMDVRSDIEEEI